MSWHTTASLDAHETSFQPESFGRKAAIAQSSLPRNRWVHPETNVVPERLSIAPGPHALMIFVIGDR